MDLLHSWGVELAVYLQTRFGRYRGVLDLASAGADLHTTFFLFFPVWFHLRRDAALRMVWVAVLGDWINLVLKWYPAGGSGHEGWGGGQGRRSGRVTVPLSARVLFGERPYWWVQETRFYGGGPRPVLQQFPITCETGPGTRALLGSASSSGDRGSKLHVL